MGNIQPARHLTDKEKYRETMDIFFKGASHPSVLRAKELMEQMNEFGYTDFNKNIKVIQKFRNQNQMNDVVTIFQEVD